MKKIKLFYLSLFFYTACFTQNIVPNPSFEDTIACPYQSGDIAKATAWTTSCGSPDYFKICNQSDWGVPINIWGYQMPASGDSYAGFLSYTTVSPDSKEFPVCNLISPLNIGTKYFVSFKVSLTLESIANPANCATNKLGAMFTTGYCICNSLITNNPQVYSNSLVTDSTNWTRITGSFIADSAYTHLSIGNFFDDINTDTVKFFNSWWDDFAYYYLDDVCVSTDSIYTNQYVYTGIAKNELAKPDFSIYPNPFNFQTTLKVSHILDNATITIYNSNGEKLKQLNNISGRTIKLYRENLPIGIYFIRLTQDNKIILTDKLIISD